MIKHIVLFKFKPKTSSEEIIRLAKELAKLKDKTEGISDYLWGANVSPEHKEKGFTHGFVMVFKNKKYRDKYIPHPAHIQCTSTYLDPILEDVLVFDFN